MDHQKLFEKGRIGSLEARNRVALPAVHIGLASSGAPSPELIGFYERRAEGGAGIITVGVCNTWPGVDSSLQNFLDLSTDDTMVGMSELVSRTKGKGALIGVQLSPLAGYNNPKWKPDPLVLPEIIKSIGKAARRAMATGFDFVEIMLSGGSILSHFLSPVHNTFDIPGYGGSFEGRSRATVEAIRTVREETDGALPVLARIHGHEFLQGGYGSGGAVRIAGLLEVEGVSAINVTGGGHRTPLPQITFHTPPMVFAHLARQVKEATTVPVFTGGQIRSRQQAEEALQISGADFVNLARALIADPDWPRKAEQGLDDEVVPCMACCKCFDQAVGGKPLRCSLNPYVGSEYSESAVPIPEHQKQALVVGSGPTGLQAAWDLHKSGHQVTVWDKSSRLGGRWRLASYLRGRGILRDPLEAFIRRLINAGVKLETGTSANPESVKKFGPDILVLAVGAKPRFVSIPGLDQHKNVITAEDAIVNPELVGDKVAIVGAGGVGVEVAIHLGGVGEPALDTLGFLARYGDRELLDEALASNAGRKVTLLRRRGFVGKGLGRSIRWTMVKELERLRVRVIDRCEYKSITEDGIEIFDKRAEQEEFIQADTIILATGYEPQTELFEKYDGTAHRVMIVGSASDVSNIGDAVAAGLSVVKELED